MNQDPLDPLPPQEPPKVPPRRPPDKPAEEPPSFGTLLLKLIGAVFAFAFIAVGLLFGSCLLR
jgi:hypothetical protein